MKVRQFLKHLLTLCILIAFGYYLHARWETFQSLVDVSWYHLGGIVVGVLITWFLMSLQSLIILRAEGVRIGVGENFFLLLATIIGNYLPMRLGTFLRLRYLKVRYGLRYARFGSVAGIRVVVHVFAVGVFGFFGLVVMATLHGVFSWMLASLFAMMIAVSLLAYCIPPPKFGTRDGKLIRVWRDFSTGFANIRKNSRLGVQLCILMFLQFVALSVRLHFAFDAIHFSPSSAIYLLLAPVTALLTIMTITPGSLGIREGAMGYVTLATGYDFQQGIFAGTIDRGVLLLLSFSLGLLSFLFIWKRLGDTEKTEEKEFPLTDNQDERSLSKKTVAGIY